ncbi:MAG: putative alpha/beta superfamily hydrolase [Flavobacterium sp.]|jgi:predicted alpha/beta superfamily hydrolase
MNILKPKQLVITTMLLLFLSTVAFSQKIEPKKRITEPDHTITSKILGRDYNLYISFPKNYSTKDTISYPVFYVLDGEWVFPIIRGTRAILDSEKELEDLIIVTISAADFNFRYQDYTTSVSTSTDEKVNKRSDIPKGGLISGGASKFLASMKTEIVPFVDKNYKTNSDRGIFGHSFGGLFTAYCLVNSDGYFTRFGISSPALWWDNEKLLNQAVTQFRENKTWEIPQTKVFISVGDKEHSGIVPTMVKYSSHLEQSDYDNVDLKWQIFEGESHNSMWSANVSKTLSILYGKKVVND